MTNLSPAAQAVLWAGLNRDSDRLVIAAAFRAAAGYMFPNDTAQQCYDKLLAIADELEDITYGTYRCELQPLLAVTPRSQL
jgi:hypothetical protein